MVFGWLIPCFFAMTVACSLAELTSAMPCVLCILCAKSHTDTCTRMLHQD